MQSTTHALDRELSQRIKGEIGLDDDQLALWFDWIEGVVCAIRADDYGDYSPLTSSQDHYSVFTALVPLGTQVAPADSVHEGLERLLLAPKLGEYGIYHVLDEGANLPLIGIHRAA